MKSAKSEEGRPVKFPAFTVRALTKHRSTQGSERALLGSDYADHDLVRALPDGNPWPPNSFSAEFRRFRHKCGLAIRYHDLRHGHVTSLMRAGIHPKIVSERLGHGFDGDHT